MQSCPAVCGYTGRPVVRIILANPRVDPTASVNCGSTALRVAALCGHTSTLHLLLADPSVDPAVDGNFAFRSAAEFGHLAAVTVLLADTRVDPAAWNNYAMFYAAANGHTSVVVLLLADPRVDPAAAMRFAIRSPPVAVVSLVTSAMRWRSRRRWLRAGAVRVC